MRETFDEALCRVKAGLVRGDCGFYTDEMLSILEEQFFENLGLPLSVDDTREGEGNVGLDTGDDRLITGITSLVQEAAQRGLGRYGAEVVDKMAQAAADRSFVGKHEPGDEG